MGFHPVFALPAGCHTFLTTWMAFIAFDAASSGYLSAKFSVGSVKKQAEYTLANSTASSRLWPSDSGSFQPSWHSSLDSKVPSWEVGIRLICGVSDCSSYPEVSELTARIRTRAGPYRRNVCDMMA